MKGRLWIKLTLAFMLVIFLGTLVTALVIQGVAVNQFQGYVSAGDRNLARQLSPLVEEVVSQGGSWEEIQDLFGDSGFLMAPPLREGQEFRRGSMMGRMGSMGPLDRAGGTPLIQRFLVTDQQGKVVADSQGDSLGSRMNRDFLDQGVPLSVTGGFQGRLFINTMVAPVTNPLGDLFLDRIRLATLFSVLVMILLSLGAVILLSLNITSPLGIMGVVAGRIARGDFSARTGIARFDELGDLGRHIDGMADSLEKAEAMKRRLIADAAHELRTPVTLIQGTLEMILDGVYDSSKERLEGLYGETELMSRLIGDLQALADWEAGNMVLEKREFSLTALGRAAADSFGVRWAQGDVEVLFSGSGEITAVGDPLRIKQVFLNLYSNALRHLPPGGRLETSFAEKPDAVVVTVTNNGPPLPEGTEDKIFERFFRVDSSRNREHGGRGLGLAIAREIILAHGGTIGAENLPDGGGVRFIFSLPR